MSHLTLVRHGQASFGADNYDQLSDLGQNQATMLGQYWAARNKTFDRVYVGPLHRHQQSWQATRLAYEQTSQTLPPSIDLADLDEHQGMEVFEHQLPQLAQRSDKLGQLSQMVLAPKDLTLAEHRTMRLRAYVHFTNFWARDEIDSGPYESWPNFCDRIRRGITTIIEQSSQNQDIVAFTSGGVIAATVGFALDIDEAKTIDLNGAVRNGSYSVFRFSKRSQTLRFSLSEFNATPHLDDDAWLTYI
ncbi:MAG: histidine phosphatase family protein [Chloroflexota bacterium]